MGRGRGGGLGGGLGPRGGGLGAPIGFGTAGTAVGAPDEPKVRHGPVKYAYTREDLVSMLERLAAASGMNGELPHPPDGIDPETVPLKTVKAGDSMYELTVEGANRGGGNARISGNSSREWTQGGGGQGVLTQGVPAPNGKVGKEVPEWADATATGGGPNGAPAAGFLGSGAVPRLTASERSVVFGESQTPSSDADVGALDRKMHAAAQQAAGGFFGLAPGGGGMDGKLIGALESDGENTNLGGGLDDAVDPPLHSTRNQTQNQTQNQQGVPPPTGPITDAPWFYLDPSGTHQGPFKRAELLEWHDSGYFPLDLPLRPADAPPSMPFVPLAEMLECGWRYPGPRVAAQMRAEHEAQMKQAAAQAREAQEAAMRARAEAEAAERERAQEAMRQREEAARQQQMQEMQRQQQMQEMQRQQQMQEMQRQQQMQEMQRQQQMQQQMQMQQQNGLHFGTSPPVPPPQQGGQTLLANLFAGGGGRAAGGGGGGAPGGPARGAVSLADLERSMSLPMAPAPGSFDAASPPSTGGSGWPNPASQTPHSHAQTHAHHHPHDTTQQVPASPPAKPAWGGASTEPPGGNSGVKSLAQIQAEEEARAEARRREEEARSRANAPVNPVVGGVWGGGGGGGGPSLAQIQAEEMRRAEAARADVTAGAHETNRTNAAAPPGGAWGGRPSAAVSQPLPGGGGGGGGFWDSLPPAATQPPAGHQRPGLTQQQQQQPRSEFPTLGATAAAAARAGGGGGGGRAAVLPGGVVGGLGGHVGPGGQSDAGHPTAPTTKAQFREWCRSEMKALHGSDDTTLVDFLVSLPSAGEVTEYVQLYLGDTARAAAFGKELIRIKRTNPQIMGGLAGGGEFAGVGPSAASGGSGSSGGVSGGSGVTRDTAGGPGEHDGWSQQPKKGKKKGK